MTKASKLYVCMPTRKRNIAITLWRNDQTKGWSVEINGQFHEHVTFDVLEALVECELIVAETSLAHEHDYGLDTLVSLERDTRA